MNSLFKFIATISLMLFNSLSYAADIQQCSSYKFTVIKDGVSHTLDVSDLRRGRRELYVLLENDDIQGLYFRELIQHLSEFTLKLEMSSLPPYSYTEESKRAIDFMVSQIDPIFKDLFWACGSAVDNITGELSLRFSKQEGEELLKHLLNPLVSQFLKFSIRQNSIEMSKEISESFNGKVMANAVSNYVGRCRAEKINAEFCDRIESGFTSGKLNDFANGNQ